MNSKRLTSRHRPGKKKDQLLQRTAQSARKRNSALIFFLALFLLLLLFLVQERLSSTQATALDILLGLFVAAMLGSWLVRRLPKATRAPAQRIQSSSAQSGPPTLQARSITVANLLRLTPGEFEEFVGDLLQATGQYHEVRRVGGAGDRGADLLAKDRFERPFIVQCKRYQPARKVNAGEIRNFLGAKGIYGADECLFVTTSTFTAAARQNMIHLQSCVFLWDGAALVQLVEEYWSHLSVRWQHILLEQQVCAD